MGGGGVRHVTLRALFLQLKGQTGRGGCFVQYSNTANHSCNSLKVLEIKYIPDITIVM